MKSDEQIIKEVTSYEGQGTFHKFQLLGAIEAARTAEGEKDV